VAVALKPGDREELGSGVITEEVGVITQPRAKETEELRKIEDRERGLPSEVGRGDLDGCTASALHSVHRHYRPVRPST
jgi:hypothetical protein